MTISELRDKRRKLLLDAQAILLASPDQEKRNSANAMIADAELVEGDIAKLQKIEALEAEERSATRPSRGGVAANETEEETRAKSLRKATFEYFRSGQASPELRDITTSTLGQGIPTNVYPELVEVQKSWGYVLNHINFKRSATGAPVQVSIVDDTANTMTVLAQGAALSTASNGDSTFSGPTINNDFFACQPVKISTAALQDYNVGGQTADQVVMRLLGKRYFRTLANAVTNGNSSNIKGIVPTILAGSSGTNFISAATGHTTTLSLTDITNLYGLLDVAYLENAKWMMGSAMRGVLLGTTVSQYSSAPLFVINTQDDGLDKMFGHDVVINPFMPATSASALTVAFGDLSTYTYNEVAPGFSVTRLNERYADTGEVGFILYGRGGGALLEGSVPSIVGLKQSAS